MDCARREMPPRLKGRTSGRLPNCAGALGPFTWHHLALEVVVDVIGLRDLELSLLRTCRSYATDFSGVGTVEHAVEFLDAALLRQRLPRAAWILRASCDREPWCRAMLQLGFAGLARPAASVDQVVQAKEDGCIFEDMLDAFNADLAGARSLPYNAKVAAAAAAPLASSAPCSRHGGLCNLWTEPPDFAVGGSPCTDFNLAGARQQADGPTMLVFLAWARKHRHWGTPVLILENVPQFPLQLVEANFGDLYRVYVFPIMAETCGFGLIRRHRRYFVLLRRGCVEMHHDLGELLQKVKDRLAGLEAEVADFLLADASEVQEEIVEFAHTRLHLRSQQFDVTMMRPEDILTPRERDALWVYKRLARPWSPTL